MAESRLFLRHFIGDEPGRSGAGQPLSNSPDIILNGATPVASLKELETPQSYGTEPPNTIADSETNYIYVRALNTSGEEAGGRLWLWYAEPEMLLWPQNWRSAGITVDGAPRNWVDVTAAPSQVVAGNAFELAPPGTPRDHYSMLAIAQSPASEPPNPPLPGAFSSIQELFLWIRENHDVAFRDTVDVSSPGPSWNTTVPIQGPGESEQLILGLQVRNMPVGSKYRFVVPSGQTEAGEEWPGVDSGQRVIARPDESIGFRVAWPANVRTAMTISWWAEGTSPQPGASLEPFIGILGSDLEGRLDDPLEGSVETLLGTGGDGLEEARPESVQIAGGTQFRFG